MARIYLKNYYKNYVSYFSIRPLDLTDMRVQVCVWLCSIGPNMDRIGPPGPILQFNLSLFFGHVKRVSKNNRCFVIC